MCLLQKSFTSREMCKEKHFIIVTDSGDLEVDISLGPPFNALQRHTSLANTWKWGQMWEADLSEIAVACEGWQCEWEIRVCSTWKEQQRQAGTHKCKL